MPRPRRTIRPAAIHVNIPEDLLAQVNLHLYSLLEGRVPHGAMSKFVEEAIRAKLESYTQKEAS